MKKDILKIAGVKSEKEFYKKYPTEAAFMKAHKKEFKKAAMGASMVNKQLTQLTDFSNPPKAYDGEVIGGIPPQYRTVNTDYSNIGKQTNNATYDSNTGMFDSSTGQVSRADTRNLGFKDSGNKTLKRTLQDLNNDDIQSGVQMTSTIGQGIQKISGAFKQKKQAKQLNALAPVIEEASGIRQDISKRRYFTPADALQGGRDYGVGTDFLAEDGAMVGGNPTEIQNMYNPGDIYSDMGYEPLNDSSKVKQYNMGGFIPRAQGGFPLDLVKEGIATGTDLFAGAINLGTEALNKRSNQILGQAGFQSGMQGVQDGQYSGFMEDGGWVSHDWQPQVITQFGGYDMKDLFKADPTMDTLRSGGNIGQVHYDPPTQEAMSTERAANGSKFKPLWGGDIEPVSYNHHMDGDGFTYEAKGNYHNQSDGRGNTGVGMDYAGKKVEVQPREPIFETGGEVGPEGQSATILGGIKMAPYALSEINEGVNKKFQAKKNQTFQAYGIKLNKKEAQQNKIMDKAINTIDSLDDNDPFTVLKRNGADSMRLGSDMALKQIAEQKNKGAYVQAAIHEAKDEMSRIHGKPLEVNAFAKGILKTDKEAMKKSKFGSKMETAQDGFKSEFDLKPWPGNKYGLGKKTASMYSSQEWEDIAKEMGFKGKGNLDFQKFLVDNPKVLPYIVQKHKELYGSDVIFDNKLGAAYTGAVDRYINRVPMQTNPIQPIGDIPVKVADKITKLGQTKKEKFDWQTPYNMLSQTFKPLIKNRLGPEQLAADMYSLATNQLEPVPSQQYSPLLETPYSVSFQDQMNANQADFNAMARQLGGNPAAIASLAAQKYAANSGVLGQQFRANQEMQMGTANRNRATLNDSFLKNLAINDTQEGRKAQAKSNTKAQAYAALSSIADKIARNKAETLAANVEANKSPQYAWGPKGRIYNIGLTKFDTDMASGLSTAQLQSLLDQKKAEEKKSGTTARNGSIVKAIKNL